MKKLIFLFLSVLLTSCRIDGPASSGDVVKTGDAEVLENAVTVYGYLNVDASLRSTCQFGILYSTDFEPSKDNGVFEPSIELDSKNKFAVTLNALSSDTEYYYKAYVRYESGSYQYGKVKSFKTKNAPVAGIELDETILSLTEGETQTLTATITPSNAPNKSVTWSSSNTSVAMVDDSGKVTAVGEGTATITVRTTDGGYTAKCSVTVKYPVPELVDLGLSVKWASCNLGASKPEEYGGYYQWAGLADVSNKSIYLDWSNCPYHTGSSSSTGWTKYVPSAKSSYWSGTGSPDNKTVLDAGDDVAHVTLDGRWRMPTEAEWQELIKNCTSEWTTLNGVEGKKFTSKKNGNSIFLPAAGRRNYDSLDDVGSDGYYWSSSLATGYPDDACSLNFGSGGVSADYGDRRYDGLSVRPVSE